MAEQKQRFVYSSPTQKERREIEEIRRQYLSPSKEETSLSRLRALHNRVYGLARVCALALGIFGTLLFGLGLTFALEWDIMIAAIPFSAAGFLIAALCYPVYAALLKRGKRKYAKEILSLSEELLKE